VRTKVRTNVEIIAVKVLKVAPLEAPDDLAADRQSNDLHTGSKSPAALAELDLAREALDSFRATAKARAESRTAQERLAHLRPEPPVGTAGTVTITLRDTVRRVYRRRFAADHSLSDVIVWARVVCADDKLDARSLRATDPVVRLTSDDTSSTLQRLGFFPGAALDVVEPRSDEKKVPLKKKPSTKPKPSELFKAIATRFDDAERPPATRLGAATAAPRSDRVPRRLAPAPA